MRKTDDIGQRGRMVGLTVAVVLTNGFGGARSALQQGIQFAESGFQPLA